jgi:serine/threonine protein kinase
LSLLTRSPLNSSRGQPENIVLKERDGKNLKIIDFGTAQDLNVNPKPQVMVGTPEFIGTKFIGQSIHTRMIANLSIGY